jgi:hypothetical protein
MIRYSDNFGSLQIIVMNLCQKKSLKSIRFHVEIEYFFQAFFKYSNQNYWRPCVKYDSQGLLFKLLD